MAYSIESTTARRCTTNLNGQQCGLAEHHTGDHVAPDGRQRWPQSIFAPLAEAWGDRIGVPRVGQKVTSDNVRESVAAVLADRISAVAQRVESETPLREALASRLDQLADQLAAERKAREALAVELVNTRRRRLSPLEDRVVKLELPYGHVQAVKDTHNALVERIEKLEQGSNRWHDIGTTWNKQVHDRIGALERDLCDTHDLAERAATAHLERKTVATHWDARSPEPPRDQTYVDDSGALWRFFNGNGWQGTPPGTKWDPHAGGYTWDELCNSRKNLSRPDFPWKVCTNG